MLRTLFAAILIAGAIALIGSARGDVRQVGFSETMSPRALGTLRRDLSVVAELEEPNSRYLRGAILSDYRDGRWSGEIARPRTVADKSLRPDKSLRVGADNSEPLKRAIVTHREAFFLPAGAVLHREERGADGKRVLFYNDGEDQSGFDSRDLAIDDALRARLLPHAERLAGQGSPRERAERLRRALAAEKRYDLGFSAPPSIDATVHFIEEAEGGHCELFASAYVLLLRALDIPARVVTGYVLSEDDPLAGVSRARKGDAHAWAEVFIDGRYHPADPTP